jgi:Ca2+-binding RTX toxin-like protein
MPLSVLGLPFESSRHAFGSPEHAVRSDGNIMSYARSGNKYALDLFSPDGELVLATEALTNLPHVSLWDIAIRPDDSFFYIGSNRFPSNNVGGIANADGSPLTPFLDLGTSASNSSFASIDTHSDGSFSRVVVLPGSTAGIDMELTRFAADGSQIGSPLLLLPDTTNTKGGQHDTLADGTIVVATTEHYTAIVDNLTRETTGVSVTLVNGSAQTNIDIHIPSYYYAGPGPGYRVLSRADGGFPRAVALDTGGFAVVYGITTETLVSGSFVIETTKWVQYFTDAGTPVGSPHFLFSKGSASGTQAGVAFETVALPDGKIGVSWSQASFKSAVNIFGLDSGGNFQNETINLDTLGSAGGAHGRFDIYAGDDGSMYVYANTPDGIVNFRIVQTDAGELALTGTTAGETQTGGAADDWFDAEGGNDTINAGGGNDRAYGGAGNDIVNGQAGNDDINGGSGNDWLASGAGSDSADGGAGVDMVSFSDLGQAVNASLLTGLATSGADTDTLTNLENITGTVYSDVLEGDAGANRLRGLGGYDWFVGTGGGDFFEGGTGYDTASYQNAIGGVTVNLSTNMGTAGQALGDTYDSIENVTGSSYADLIYGNAGQNNFRGLAGYDIFVGSTGGRERYDGGSGSDSVTYFQSTSGVSASLNLGYGYGGDARLDLYTSI